MGGEQQSPSRPQIGQRLHRRSGLRSLQDVEAREDRAIGVGSPAIDPEDCPRREAKAAPVKFNTLFGNRMAEPDPLFDLALFPGQLDEG